MLFATIDGIGLLACLMAGGAGGLFIAWLLQSLAVGDAVPADEWRHDVSRIHGLRRTDVLFRLFQPVIQFLARVNRAAFREYLPEIDRDIQTAGLSRFWLPEEYLGRAELIALLLLPSYLVVGIWYLGAAGLVVAILGTALTVWWQRSRLHTRAAERLAAIKRRLPFLLDLMTLLMEAGSSFLQALRQGVREFEGHAVATEFARVLTDINMGKSRGEAFDNLRHRLNDEEIGNIVGSIIQSEQLGTPLSDIFRTQSDVLRLKRSQRAEALAGEAGVKMLLPGVLVMLATVLIILGPFVINYWYLGLGF